MNIMTGKAIIETAIKRVYTSDKRLYDDKLACSFAVLNHAEQHNDVSLCTRMHDAIRMKSEQGKFRRWCETYGRMTWESGEVKDTDGNKIGVVHGFKTKKGWTKQALSQAAMDHPYLEKQEKVEKPYDLGAEKAKIVKFLTTAAERAAKNGKHKFSKQLYELAAFEVSKSESTGGAKSVTPHPTAVKRSTPEAEQVVH